VTARAVLAALLAAGAAVAGDAPPERIRNAKVEVRPAGAGLAAALRAAGPGPVWLAYDVPAEAGHSMCCWDSVESIGHARGGCRLDGHNVTFNDDAQESPVHLEGERLAVVYLRVEGGRVERLRVLSRSCSVDAGGRALIWLSGVAPADSAAFLASLLDDPAQRRMVDEVLMALGVHTEPAALERMVKAARSNPSSRVRSQALFWLAQKAGRRATEEIERSVSEDPESQVRQQAVFALSQLPREEGVPKLIALARSHRDPHVRERAMFWLGQSEDPRALAFFEQVLRN